VTSKPSSLFSLFFPKIYSERIRFAAEILACGQSGPAKNSGALRCFSLFLMLIEIGRDFTDLRRPSSSLARPQDMGPAGPPVFAENLQALTISLAITTPPLSKSSYCYLSCQRNAVIHAASCRCKLLQKYAIVN
jgi:hypothetical protein